MVASAFTIISTTNWKKGYSPGQLIFGRGIILLIRHKVDLGLIRQRKQAQINKYDISENRHRVEYDYKVGYKVMLNNHNTYIYETPYKVPFLIT